jgi:hypothetical protein
MAVVLALAFSWGWSWVQLLLLAAFMLALPYLLIGPYLIMNEMIEPGWQRKQKYSIEAAEATRGNNILAKERRRGVGRLYAAHDRTRVPRYDNMYKAPKDKPLTFTRPD